MRCLCPYICAEIQGAPREKKGRKWRSFAAALKKKVVTCSVLFLCLFLFFIDFLNALFGRFVTRGVQKHEKTTFFGKIHLGSSQKMWRFFRPFLFVLFFLPRLFDSIFFNRVFGRFVTRGVQKRDKKNRAKISSAPKKSSSLLASLFFFFHGAPWPLALASCESISHIGVWYLGRCWELGSECLCLYST
jgi:hypothetical protein